jgi:hypothetical protein
MEPLWSPVLAIGGNQRQVGCPSKPQEQAKSVATGCDRLRAKFHGKEGVDGSSPSGALQKRRTAALSCSGRLARTRTCGGYGAVYGAFASRTRALSRSCGLPVAELDDGVTEPAHGAADGSDGDAGGDGDLATRLTAEEPVENALAMSPAAAAFLAERPLELVRERDLLGRLALDEAARRARGDAALGEPACLLDRGRLPRAAPPDAVPAIPENVVDWRCGRPWHRRPRDPPRSGRRRAGPTRPR